MSRESLPGTPLAPNDDIDIQWSTVFLIPRGEIASATFAVSGAIEAGLTARAPDDLSVACMWNLVELARGRGIPIPERKWHTTFTIGPIPVILTHKIEPYAQIMVGASIATGASVASASGRIGIRAGASYSSAGGWQPIWEPTRSADASLMVNDPGTLSVSAGLSFGLGYSMMVYDAFGPGFGFGPRGVGTFRVGEDHCTWSADFRSGIELTGSFDIAVPVIDYKLASYSISEVVSEAIWAQTGGRYESWCADAGPPDGGPTDAGVATPDAGVPDAGVRDSGGVDAGPGMPGAPCVVAGDCASGFCADGVCCNTRCDGECMSCVAATSRSPDGTCDAIREDTDPDLECPGPQTCQAYRTTPVATAYCNAHFGDPCTGEFTRVDCPGAGRCIEGVCCDNLNCHTSVAPCTSCLRMYTGLPDGDCQTILAPMDPYDTCSGASVCWGGTAAPGCCLPPGSTCVAASDCCSRTCTASTCT